MILVLGTGRCGTSVVAKILHNNGVNMGKMFLDEQHGNTPQPLNEDTNYEDSEFLDMHMRHVKMREPFRVFEREEPFGLKDPNMPSHPELMQKYLDMKPRIILCTRDKNDTIKSFIKTYGYSREKATGIYNERATNLMKVKPDLVIDCYDTDKEEKIKKFI